MVRGVPKGAVHALCLAGSPMREPSYLCSVLFARAPVLGLCFFVSYKPSVNLFQPAQVFLTTSASQVSDDGAALKAALDAAVGQPLRARALLVAFLTRFVELVTLGHEQVVNNSRAKGWVKDLSRYAMYHYTVRD